MYNNIKVLIVDDEEIVVAGIKKGLEFKGWNVSTILGGAEAIKLVSRQHFDVVVLDLVMPGLDGVETCKGIKKVSPKTEVLLLSGVPSALEQKVRPFLDAGGRDLILRKPLFAGEVASAIEQLLQGKGLL